MIGVHCLSWSVEWYPADSTCQDPQILALDEAVDGSLGEFSSLERLSGEVIHGQCVTHISYGKNR